MSAGGNLWSDIPHSAPHGRKQHGGGGIRQAWGRAHEIELTGGILTPGSTRFPGKLGAICGGVHFGQEYDPAYAAAHAVDRGDGTRRQVRGIADEIGGDGCEAMKLLNFCIGQVQTVQIGSEPVKTAHIKAPIAEPWIVTEQGAQGDQRAVHPDKIYAFARPSYDYWGDRLRIDSKRWPDGFFGENLTVDELDEESVRIGDVFAVGNDVQLIVSGARTPCLKLAWRLSQPRSFQKTFALSRRTGAYFDVLAPGVVHPGDDIRRIAHDSGMPSIADVCDFVASHRPPPLEPLQRLLAMRRLSPTLRLLLGAKLDFARREAQAGEGRWPGWREFSIARIVEETPDVRSVYLRPTDRKAICPPRPGQFVAARMADHDGSAVTRTWSVSAFAPDMTEYRVSVKRQRGAGSRWMHRARPGAMLMLRAPAGEFALDMGSFRPVTLVAAGIGITPLMAMLQAQVLRPQAAPVHLIYGVRTAADLVFREELTALAASSPQVHLRFLYSGEAIAGRVPARISAETVIESLGQLHIELAGQRVDLPWHESDIYLCGPMEFCGGLKADFVARGANPDRIFFELFQAPAGTESTVSAAVVRFNRSGRECQWHSAEDLSLLELAERNGIEVEHDCRSGSCLTCRTTVLEGASSADTGDGAALLCIGRPTTSLLVLDR